MARNSSARDAFRSLLPEARLLASGDNQALHYKYRAQLGDPLDRLITMGNIAMWPAQRVSDDLAYEELKLFGGIGVEGDCESPVEAIDTKHNQRIRSDKKDAILLHVYSILGHHSFRDDLATAAHYIDGNPKLRSTPLVAGITYGELGKFASAFGFRSMHVKEIDTSYELDVRAYHRAYCAINQTTAPFEMSVAYLPTEVFIGTFKNEQ